ncbi:MAG: hypothetical protein ACK6D2_10375 [Planctomycetota bacterium]
MTSKEQAGAAWNVELPALEMKLVPSDWAEGAATWVAAARMATWVRRTWCVVRGSRLDELKVAEG